MFEAVEKAIKFIKKHIDISDEEIDRVLNQDFFRDIDKKLGGLQSFDSFLQTIPRPTTEELENFRVIHDKKIKEVGYDSSIYGQIFEKMIQGLGFTSCKPLIEHFAGDWNPVSAGFERRFYRITNGTGENISLEEVAIKGIDILIDKGIFTEKEIRRFLDLANAYKVLYNPEYIEEEQEIIGDENLKPQILLALRILKTAYSLSDEETRQLTQQYSYKFNNLGERVGGRCDYLTTTIEINSKKSDSMLKTIIHEMIHALGIYKEGLTEYLAQKAYLKYLIILKQFKWQNDDVIEDGIYYIGFREPEKIRYASYQQITDKYQDMFEILDRLGIGEEIIAQVVRGRDIKSCLELRCYGNTEIDKFFETTSEMESIYYDYAYGGDLDDEKLKELSSFCDEVLFNFSIKEERNLEIENILESTKLVENATRNMTIGDFLNLKAKLEEGLSCRRQDRDNLRGAEEYEYYERKSMIVMDVVEKVLDKVCDSNKYRDDARSDISWLLEFMEQKDIDEGIIFAIINKGEGLKKSDSSKSKRYTIMKSITYKDVPTGEIYEEASCLDESFEPVGFYNMIAFKDGEFADSVFEFDAVSINNGIALSKEVLTPDDLPKTRVVTLDTRISDIIRRWRMKESEIDR